MLGTFLEFSTSVVSVAPEAQFYRSLGFEDLPTADFLPGPYAALWDGSVTVGLHEREGESPVLTFVRQDLAAHSRALRRRGVEFDEIRLGDEEFNRATARDPGGVGLALLEARTYSPGTRDPSRISACGDFAELSLSTVSVDAAVDFWTGLGLELAGEADTPHRSARLAGHGLVIGFHETRLAPGLSYVADDFEGRCAYLGARGFELERGARPGLTRGRSATLRSPSGMAFYLHERAG